MNKYRLYIENYEYKKECDKFSDIYDIMSKIQPSTLNVEIYRTDLKIIIFKGTLENVLTQIKYMKKYMEGRRHVK